MRVSHAVSWLTLAVAAVAGQSCGTGGVLSEGTKAMVGKGGQTERATVMTSAPVIARMLARSQPAPAWQAAAGFEGADLIQFLDDRRILMGGVEVDAWLARPSPRWLTLLDATSGRTIWRVERPALPQASYAVVATAPTIVLAVSDGNETRFTAFDPDSGARRWESVGKAPVSFTRTTAAPLLVTVAAEASGNGKGIRVRALDLSTGASRWERVLPDLALAGGAAPAVLALGDAILVGGARVVQLAAADGQVRWTAESPAADSAAPMLDPLGTAILAWSPRSTALLDAATGRSRWTIAAGPSRTKVIAATPERLYRIRWNPAGAAGGALPADTVEALDVSSGKALWSTGIGEPVMSPLAVEQGLVIFTVDDAAVGLDAVTGRERFRTRFPVAVAARSPSEAPLWGRPDLLRARGSRMLIARELAGVMALSLPGGALTWYQPRYFATTYSTSGTTNALRATIEFAGYSTTNSAKPAAAPALYWPPDYNLAAAQRNYDFTRPGTAARYQASGQLAVAEQMHSASERMESAAELAQAAIGLSNALEKAFKIEAIQGATARVSLLRREVSATYAGALEQRYYYWPFLSNFGQGVTVVDLETGRRHDLYLSPLMAPALAFGLHQAFFPADPSERRLIAVGTGLDADHYETYVKWKWRMPQPLILAFDLTSMPFTERNLALDSAVTRSERIGLVQDAFEDAMGRLDLEEVRSLLARGANVNGLMSDGKRPLTFVASNLDVEMVKLLLAHGAEINALDPYGLTARDYAPRFSTLEKALKDAGGKHSAELKK